MEKVTINLPESWGEVPIEQFQELSTYAGDSSILKAINIIACLANVDNEIIKTMSTEDLKNVTETLKWSSQVPSSDFKHTLTIDGVEYSMVPKLNELTVGEWIDLDGYSDDFIANMHLIMAVLYRPLITVINDKTRFIEKYDALKCIERAKLFREKVFVSEVYGAALFFLSIGVKFTSNLAIFLEEQSRKTILEENRK